MQMLLVKYRADVPTVAEILVVAEISFAFEGGQIFHIADEDLGKAGEAIGDRIPVRVAQGDGE